MRHGDVEHEDVGEEPLDQFEGLRAVSCLPDHLDIAGSLQEGAEPLADQVVIVGDDDADHDGPFQGTRATRRVPRPGWDVMSSRPFNKSSRSRIPMSPIPDRIATPN